MILFKGSKSNANRIAWHALIHIPVNNVKHNKIVALRIATLVSMAQYVNPVMLYTYLMKLIMSVCMNLPAKILTVSNV